MPLFMDIHRNVEASSEDLAAAHLSDLEVQEKYGARYIKYWVNQNAQTLCCLVEAPDAVSASKVHAEAHGQVADKLIEVERAVVEAFLGDSTEADLGRMVDPDGNPDGGFRIVLFTDIQDSTSMTQRLGDARALEVIRVHDGIVRREVELRSGRLIKHTGDGLMVAFSSAPLAIEAAIQIQRALQRHNQRGDDHPIRVRIGISAGEPVDVGGDLFGATVQLARRLCDAAPVDKIYVCAPVRELCPAGGIGFAEVGAMRLKGFAEAVPTHEVLWSD